jgi:hypothetical protein
MNRRTTLGPVDTNQQRSRLSMGARMSMGGALRKSMANGGSHVSSLAGEMGAMSLSQQENLYGRQSLGRRMSAAPTAAGR